MSKYEHLSTFCEGLKDGKTWWWSNKAFSRPEAYTHVNRKTRVNQKWGLFHFKYLEANKLVFSIFTIIKKICQKIWAKPPSKNEKKKKKIHFRLTCVAEKRLCLSSLLSGGTPHMKGVRMLVVSLRGINFGFWSHLGCSGQNAIIFIFSREGLV